MAITIRGVRIETMSFERDAENGGFKTPQASYSLISSADKVLATQTIGGYGGIALEPSAPTKKAFDDFAALYLADVNAVLGLGGE